MEPKKKSRRGFYKGMKRPPNAGRKKGTPNRMTVAIKDAVLAAFHGVGGQAYLEKMARSKIGANKRAMLSMFSKLIPLEVTGKDGGPVSTVHVYLPENGYGKK